MVQKVILEAPNAPVATLVNRERVSMARAKHVWRVNLVHPMTILLIRAHHAKVAIINQARVKRLVCRAFLARMKTLPVLPNVKIAASGNIKMHLAMIRVWIAKWANT